MKNIYDIVIRPVITEQSMADVQSFCSCRYLVRP